MAIQSQPSRIPEPFAGSGTKNTIPATNATPSASQAASWASGFPPECSQPISAGGCPVPRNDVNGALNQISQDFAFRQDGGIWAWSALADYDVSRMVRGSDGRLYWSVAQSGPGIAAGAVDPTTDDGTYWQSPYAKTMTPLDSSAAVATTEWVRTALGPAPLYVDVVSGSDSNDGLSAGSAVQTIGTALALANSRAGFPQEVHLAAGTYPEFVEIKGKNIEFILDGNVSITDGIEIQSSSLVISDSNSYTLSVSKSGAPGILCVSSSRLYCSSLINISSSDSSSALHITSSSICYFGKQATISCSSVDNAFVVRDNSVASLYGALTVSGTVNTYGIRVERSSCCSVFAGVSLPNSSMTSGLLVDSVSCVFIGEGGSITAYASGVGVITISKNSIFESMPQTTVTAINTGSSTWNSGCLHVESGSSAVIKGNLSISNSASTGCLVYASEGSYVGLEGATCSFAGTVGSATVMSRVNSCVYFTTAATATGSVTGKRYDVNVLSSINVSGKGANFIPGSSAGTVASASYGYYG